MTRPPRPAPGAPPVVAPGPVPVAFPCPECGTIVVVPYDPVTGALLDWLLYLEEHLPDLSCPGATVAYEIVVALHAVREKLEVQQ